MPRLMKIGINDREISLLHDRILLVGLGHKARNGKHYFARRVQRYLTVPSGIYAFADSLKAMCRLTYGMKKKNPAILLSVGDRYRRIDPCIFVEALSDALEESADDIGPHVALIADVRYPEEADFIQRHGLLLKVTLAEHGKPIITSDGRADHTSENSLNDYRGWDYTFSFEKENPLIIGLDAICMAKKFSEMLRSVIRPCTLWEWDQLYKRG